MGSKPLNISLLGDAVNQELLDLYQGLMHFTPYTQHHVRTLFTDQIDQKSVIHTMNSSDITLALLGVPGRGDYNHAVTTILNHYAACAHKPALGLASHSPKETQASAGRWLAQNPQLHHQFPAGLVNVIDTSTPLTPIRLNEVMDSLKTIANERHNLQFSAIPIPSVASFRISANTANDLKNENVSTPQERYGC